MSGRVGAWGYGLGRVSESDWVKKRGWVEGGSGNLVVWGAPEVERLGRAGDTNVKGGSRLV
jgi:cytochrome c oxidase assembly factor 3